MSCKNIPCKLCRVFAAIRSKRETTERILRNCVLPASPMVRVLGAKRRNTSKIVYQNERLFRSVWMCRKEKMTKDFDGFDDLWIEKAPKYDLEIAYEGVLQGLAGNNSLKEKLENTIKALDVRAKIEEERYDLARKAEDVFLEVFQNFCAAYFIKAKLDASVAYGYSFAFASFEWGGNDFELFDTLVGVSRFEYTSDNQSDSYVPFEIDLRRGFFNTLLGIESIVLKGYFETDGGSSCSRKVSDLDLGFEMKTSEQITTEHIAILSYVAGQTVDFQYTKEKGKIDQYRRMRKAIIQEGLKEVVEGTMTKEDFEQKLFLQKLAGF